MAFPELFDEYQICISPPWKNKEVIYLVLSLVYGTFLPFSTAHPPTSNPFRVKDALALLIIIYSAKRYGDLTRVGGVPSLLDKIRQDATVYFLVVSTGHLVFLFFQIFAPVSDHHVDLCFAAHDKRAHRIGLNVFLESKSPSKLSQKRQI